MEEAQASTSASVPVTEPIPANIVEPTKKRAPPKAREIVPGQSLLPASRVAKIIKSDKDIAILSKEALFLISIAAEQFVKKLTEASYVEARMRGHKAIQYKDLATAIQQNETFFYLQEVIPMPIAVEAALKLREDKIADDLGLITDAERQAKAKSISTASTSAALPPLPTSEAIAAQSTEMPIDIEDVVPPQQSASPSRAPTLNDLMNPAPDAQSANAQIDTEMTTT